MFLCALDLQLPLLTISAWQQMPYREVSIALAYAHTAPMSMSSCVASHGCVNRTRSKQRSKQRSTNACVLNDCMTISTSSQKALNFV